MNIRKILLSLSILFFLIGLSLKSFSEFNLIVLTPLLFGIFSFILLPEKIKFGPGVSMVFVIMLIRYILSPTLHYISGFDKKNNIDSDSFYTTFYLVQFEMIFILILIRYFTKKQRNSINKARINNKASFNDLSYKNYSYILPLLFLGLSVALSLQDPSAINRYNFIVNNSVEMTVTDMDEVTNGLPRILNYTHFILLVTLFFYFFRKYKKYKSNKYFVIGILSVLILSSFYTDQSRNSMLLPLLTLLFMSIKFYSSHRIKIIFSFTLFIFLSMSLLSLMKFFKTTEVTDGLINTEVTADLLDDYFAGYQGILDGVKNIGSIRNKTDSETILNEIFGNTIFIGSHFNLENRTSVFYNEALYHNSYIIPTIVQGYSYFGLLLAGFFTFIIIYLVFFFDRLFFLSNRVDMAFLFAFAAVKLGWMHQGNFIVAMTHINNILVLYLIFKANEVLGKNLVFRGKRISN